MKKITFLFALLIPFLGILGVWGYALFLPVVSTNEGVIFYLKPGMSKTVVISQLSEEGLVPYPKLFSIYAYPQVSAHLKTGEYFFPKGSSPASIWRQIIHGTGMYSRRFAIIPGWTFKQLRQALLQTDTLRHTSAALDDKQIMEHLGYPNVEPEGEFFPDTYNYARGISDLVILKRAIDLMQSRLNEAWQKRANDLPFKSAYEALIAASLIEKEAYLNSERPIIAGVLVNRLRKDMLLQFDPTVIYGMGDQYTGKIHKEDLQQNTAFNTYVHKGLTPTPIAMPSMASIQAVMHPIQHDYYYFVARGDGSHQFSKTLQEHNSAVSEAIKRVSYFNDSKVQNYLLPKFNKQFLGFATPAFPSRESL